LNIVQQPFVAVMEVRYGGDKIERRKDEIRREHQTRVEASAERRVAVVSAGVQANLS
jgi:hypothetical protein